MSGETERGPTQTLPDTARQPVRTLRQPHHLAPNAGQTTLTTTKQPQLGNLQLALLQVLMPKGALHGLDGACSCTIPAWVQNANLQTKLLILTFHYSHGVCLECIPNKLPMLPHSNYTNLKFTVTMHLPDFSRKTPESENIVETVR